MGQRELIRSLATQDNDDDGLATRLAAIQPVHCRKGDAITFKDGAHFVIRDFSSDRICSMAVRTKDATASNPL
jgi:hypothetical protein